MSENTEDAGTEPRAWKYPTGSPLPAPDPTRTEPRRSEYPFAGMLPRLIGADEVQAMRTLSESGIGYVEYLDAWVDKGVADGTLTLDKAARYREAIAQRCCELGEVPHRQEHIARLDLKAGDILALTAPSDSQVLMRQMGEHTKEFLKHAGVDGVEVVVFPRGTEIHVLEGAAAATSVEDLRQVRAGTMTADRFREELAGEMRRISGYRPGHL